MMTILLAVIIILILFILINSSALEKLYIYYIKLANVPGVPGIPFLGPIFQIIKLNDEERLKWITQNSFKYKDGIFKIWLGGNVFVRIRKPEHLEIVLPSTVNITKSFFYDHLHAWLGRGLITAAGDKWFHDRKLITPAFHFAILEQFAVTMTEKTEIFIKCLEKQINKNPEKTIDILPPITLCTLDTISETAMGVDIHAQDDVKNEYADNVLKIALLSTKRFFKPWNVMDSLYYRSEDGKQSKALVEATHKFTEDLIKRKKLARQQKNGECKIDKANDDIGKPKRKAFLDLLLDANEGKENPLTDKEIREQVDTFMFAGHETTAAAVSWSLFALGSNLDIQDKLHEELDDYFGDSKKPATTKDLSELKYFDRVFSETLRLYPSAPEISRKLDSPVKIGDIVIPKNSHLGLSPYLTHRDPEIWPEPQKFDPDRFLPENAKNRHPYAYIPFSAGPRNCIGKKYAQLEVKLILIAVLRRWKVKSTQALDEVGLYSALILRTKNGIFLKFTPKKQSD